MSGSIREEERAPRKQHRCARCGSTSVLRTIPQVRGVFGAVLRAMGRRRYLCRDCGRRFIDRPIHGD